ncbi:hypothetical protein ACS126_03600 [Sphingobacterium lactis]|uniref:hypothetical protein n=1 Tax=Sphingobacterium TaxID=28453 RepID=UPI0021A49046|nr:hypothetical protein [Sphingobacterium hotanense]MCT1526068.1 hypothetical protein [Sphingobacterium hotanense]
MSILKSNWLRTGLLLTTFLLGVFFVVKAMGESDVKADTKKASAPTTYFYNGPSSGLETNVMDPDNWSTSQASAFECGQPTNIPCSLEVPEDKDIEQHLDDLGNLANVQAATNTRRSE